jgi:hypothetical protein
VSGSINDFFISFADLQISKEKDEEIFVYVVDVILTNSFYNINSSNNRFKVEHNNTDGPMKTLDEGNYNMHHLLSAIYSKITYVNFVASYDTISGKITLTHGHAGTTVISFDVSNSINEILGFTTDTITFTSPSSVTGTSVANVGTPLCIYVNTSITNQNLQSNNQVGNLEVSCLLCKIPILVPNFSNVYFYSTNDSYRQNIPDENLDKMHFRLTDQDFKPVELNKNWLMTLCFEKVKKTSVHHKQLDSLEELVKINKMHFLSLPGQ